MFCTIKLSRIYDYIPSDNCKCQVQGIFYTIKLNRIYDDISLENCRCQGGHVFYTIKLNQLQIDTISTTIIYHSSLSTLQFDCIKYTHLIIATD